MKKEWIYHKPVFQCDEIDKVLYQYSPWAGLRGFAYDYLAASKPGKVVELGSHYGCSSFAFMQAIKDENLHCSFYAIDTWKGDAFTKNDYQEDVYSAYKKVQETLFRDIDAYMVRMTFDEAVGEFEDQSIDLLHIDGSHMYEDVKHDFLTWLTKVKKDGVIFFHDVGKDLFQGELMGSHVYWEELASSYPYRIELPFSCGLGILMFSPFIYEDLKKRIDVNHYQAEINIQDSLNKAVVRENYFKIKSQDKYIDDLNRQKAILQDHLARYKTDMKNKDDYIEELEKKNVSLANDLKEKDKFIQGLNEQIESSEKRKDQYIGELETAISSCNALIKTKERYISELELNIQQLNDYANSKSNYIEELKRDIDGLNEYSNQKRVYAEKLEKDIKSLNNYAESKEKYIQELKEQLQKSKTFSDDKERYLAKLQEQLRQLNAYAEQKKCRESELERDLKELGEFVKGKEEYIRELESHNAELKLFIQGKEKYILELEADKRTLEDFANKKEAYSVSLEEQIQTFTNLQDDLASRIESLNSHVNELNNLIEAKLREIQVLEEEKRIVGENLCQSEQKNAEQSILICQLERLIEEEETLIKKLPFGERILQRIKYNAK